MEKPKNPKQYVGKKVRMIDKDKHANIPSWYPKVGTVGTIISFGFGEDSVRVEWGKNSDVDRGLGDYAWYIDWKSVELVDDTRPNQPSMTNEEIWEMLKPKMEKLGINYSGTYIRYSSILDEPKNYMDIPTVQKLVATVYRSGYGRGQKGRPFKIGEKKKKGGHWEPVNIEDVLKSEYKVVENCLGWQYEHLGTYKKGEDGKFYQWVEDDE